MDRYKILFDVIDKDKLKVNILESGVMLYGETLTIGQGFDIVLIRVLDKILRKNRIRRLSLKSVEISGKIEPSALSGMMIKSMIQALEV